MWGRISYSKKLWHIKVTWLPESSRDGIFFLPHPMFILGHVAMALCITSIFTWAETCWLEIISIKPAIPLLSEIVLSIWSGPQTLFSIRLVQGLRSHYFFGNHVLLPVLTPAFFVAFSWANSCANLLLNQTQLSLKCPVSLQ